MAERYARLPASLWESDIYRDSSPAARQLLPWLHAPGSGSSYVGLHAVRADVAAFHIGLSVDDVDAALDELNDAGWLIRDADAGVVFVIDYAAEQVSRRVKGGEKPDKRRASCLADVESCPSLRLREAWIGRYREPWEITEEEAQTILEAGNSGSRCRRGDILPEIPEGASAEPEGASEISEGASAESEGASTERREEKRRERREEKRKDIPEGHEDVPVGGGSKRERKRPLTTKEIDSAFDAFEEGRRALYRKVGALGDYRTRDGDRRDESLRKRAGKAIKAHGLETIQIAARNNALSPHHRGENDRNERFLGLAYVLRNVGGYVDRCPSPDFEAYLSALDAELAADRRRSAPPPPVGGVGITLHPDDLVEAEGYAY